MVIIVINAIFVLFCLRIFSPRLMDRVDSLFPSLFPPTSSSFFFFPSSASISSFSLSHFPSLQERRMQPRGNHAPFVMRATRSVGRVCKCGRNFNTLVHTVHTRRTQCTRNEVVSPLVISETFLPARKSLRNERRLHTVIAALNYAVLRFGFSRFMSLIKLT